MTISFITKKEVDINTILFGYILSGIALPISIQLILTGAEILEFKRINKILSNVPFTQLENIGFTKTFTNNQSKGDSSKPMLIGIIDDYTIKLEVEKEL